MPKNGEIADQCLMLFRCTLVSSLLRFLRHPLQLFRNIGNVSQKLEMPPKISISVMPSQTNLSYLRLVILFQRKTCTIMHRNCNLFMSFFYQCIIQDTQNFVCFQNRLKEDILNTIFFSQSDEVCFYLSKYVNSQN